MSDMSLVLAITIGTMALFIGFAIIVMTFTKIEEGEPADEQPDDPDPDNPDLAQWEDNGGPDPHLCTCTLTGGMLGTPYYYRNPNCPLHGDSK